MHTLPQKLTRTHTTAADIKKGNEVLKLRENNGIPVWPRIGARSVAHQ
jgi:hypothetical protein